MVQQRRRAESARRLSPPAPPVPASPRVIEALFCDLEAVGRLRPRTRAAVEAFTASVAVGQLATFSVPVRRSALRRLPHGIPSAKSWLAVCRLSPHAGRPSAGPGRLTRR